MKMTKDIRIDSFRIDKSEIIYGNPSIKEEIRNNIERQNNRDYKYISEQILKEKDSMKFTNNSFHNGISEDDFNYMVNSYLKSKSEDIDESNKLFRERQYLWLTATKDNAFEDAKDFENFVYKWIDKGLSFDEAVARAALYSQAGVLDYGKQKVTIYDNLPYPDPKNHGFHLIDNQVLKKSFIDTLDQLSLCECSVLISSLFGDIGQITGNPDLNEKANDTDGFLEKFQAFALKLEKLKEENPDDFKDIKFSFTGDITINDKQSIDYQNFILETIISFFEDRLDYYDNLFKTASFQMFYEYPLSKDEHNEVREKELAIIRDPLKKLLENFKNSASQYNSDINENKSILNQYTKNNRPNILNTIQ